MGTITSGIGLISGINTSQLIDQLMAIEAQPQQLVQQRVQVLQTQQTAFQTISAQLLNLQATTATLVNAQTYNATTANSSNQGVLTATGSATATPGSYAFTVSRLVSNQQLITNGFGDSDQTPLNGGTLTFEFGAARLDSNTNLNTLNGGAGVPRGKIRITDRSGASALVDLSQALTVNDVLDAINNTSGINVTASVNGDALQLTDNTGGSGTLSAANTGGTTTATALGLTSNTGSDPATLAGAQINRVSSNTLLTALNDGNGVRMPVGHDLTFDNGTTNFNVDLTGSTTLGQVIAAINGATGNTFVTAAVNDAGTGLKLTPTGGGTLTVGGASAADLGLAVTGAAGTVTGGRLIAGLNSRLIKNLNGGTGAALGVLHLTPRSDPGDGSTGFDVDLSGAQSVADVLKLINTNAANAGRVQAALNTAGNGLLLTDQTGATTSAFQVGGAAAAGLHLTTPASGNTIDSGNLQFRYISESTRLASLNGGQGMARGQFRITDSAGMSAVVDLTQGNEQTIQDVLDEINSRGLKVTARVNDNGDGILLQDTNTGPQVNAIKVDEVGSTTARDLGLLGQADAPGHNLDGSFEKKITIANVQHVTAATALTDLNSGSGVRQVTGADFTIARRDGTSFNVDLDGAANLGDVISRINTASGGNVTASINSLQTGLKLVDSTSGTSTFKVTALSSSLAAQDLGILASSDASGNTINGSAVVATTTLANLAQKINDAGFGVQAMVINDGSGANPYRLSLISTRPGSGGAFVFDDSQVGLGATTLVEAQDAVAFYGASDPAKAVAITSSTNTLTTVIPGVTLNLTGTGATQVTVSQDDSVLSGAVKDLTDKFNSLLDTVNKFDSYNSDTQQRGLLLGDPTIANVRDSVYGLLNGWNTQLTGKFQSLGQLGVTVGDSGKLTFDSTKLSAALAQDRDAVKALFTLQTYQKDASGNPAKDPNGNPILTAAGTGVQLNNLLKNFTDSSSGLLKSENDTLQSQIDLGNQRIAEYTTLLAQKKQQLQDQYNAMEQALASLQSQSSAIASMITPTVSSSSSTKSSTSSSG